MTDWWLGFAIGFGAGVGVLAVCLAWVRVVGRRQLQREADERRIGRNRARLAAGWR